VNRPPLQPRAPKIECNERVRMFSMNSFHPNRIICAISPFCSGCSSIQCAKPPTGRQPSAIRSYFSLLTVGSRQTISERRSRFGQGDRKKKKKKKKAPQSNISPQGNKGDFLMLFHTVSLIREANAEFHRLLSAAVESGSESGVVRKSPTDRNTPDTLCFFFALRARL
jgi:hypothetical protein